jgi:mxaD protein
MKKSWNPQIVIAAFSVFAFSILASTWRAHAHGPTPQKISQVADINAPPDKVWAVIRDFGRISAWNPALRASKADKGNQPGSTRTLSFKKGGNLTESLDEYDAAAHSYSYRMGEANLKALPLSSYSATISVVPGDVPDSSHIEWNARGYRGDTSNEPPEELSDEAAVEALSNFMRSGLDALKQKLEGHGR